MSFRGDLQPLAVRAACVLAAASMLGGCSLFQPNPVPPPPPPPDSALPAAGGDTQAFEQWLVLDQAGRVSGFQPLQAAESAVAEAQNDPAAAEHGAAELAQAQAMLERARQQWRAVRAAPLDAPEALAQAGHSGEQAQRLAAIAVALGERARARRDSGESN